MHGWDMEKLERQVRIAPEGVLCALMDIGYEFQREWAIDEMRNRWNSDQIKTFIECINW